MNKTANRVFILLLVCYILFPFSPNAFAEALPTWKGGIVTKAPWVEVYNHIEINGERYTFNPKGFSVEREYKMSVGGFTRKEMPLTAISVGQPVVMKVLAHRIYKLIVSE
jgi:hypothetical protein